MPFCYFQTKKHPSFQYYLLFINFFIQRMPIFMFLLCSMLAIRNIIRGNNAYLITTSVFCKSSLYCSLSAFVIVCHVVQMPSETRRRLQFSWSSNEREWWATQYGRWEQKGRSPWSFAEIAQQQNRWSQTVQFLSHPFLKKDLLLQLFLKTCGDHSTDHIGLPRCLKKKPKQNKTKNTHRLSSLLLVIL